MVLVNLSGGIDSAYCMQLMLEQGHNVLAHHIRLKNWEGRQQLEYKATQDIIKHFRKEGYAKQIKYHETGFDYGTLRYIAYDIHIWTFFTGIILTNPSLKKSIEGVVISSHQDSPFMRDTERDSRRRELIKSMLSGWEPKWLYPIGHLLKKDVVRACPKDLLDLCWWCRRPYRNKPCGRCHTCRQVKGALKEGSG